MTKLVRSILFGFLFLALAAPVFAQDAEFRVHAQREFGYQKGGEVRGNFALTVTGSPETIQSVTYLLDGQQMATVSAAPFKYSFRTYDYPDGVHQLSAVVTTKDNRQVTTPAVSINFLSSQQESESMKNIIIPLVGGLLLVILVAAGGQYLVTRRSGHEHLAPGAERHYGLKGGAICPRGGRACAIHFWSLNLLTSYFDRCDYCGRWGIVRARSRAELDAAVQAEAAAAQASESSLPGVQAAETEEERLRKMMDESKYVE